MTPILLYWNHICVLHRQEKLFLEQLVQRLRHEDIALTVRFFGLGYPEHMSEYLAKSDAELPDAIVSADLEVFEDSRIYTKFSHMLYPAARWLPLRKGPAQKIVSRGEALLPFVSIPLVYYTRDPAGCADKCLWEVEALAFGGIDNSAGKTLVKAVWDRYGKEKAHYLLSRSCVSDMPIGAYNLVRTGAQTTALVPSLYALRADGDNTFLETPKEGPLLVSSYFCACNTIPEQIAKKLALELLNSELCEFYAQNGDLIVHPDCSIPQSAQESDQYLVPKNSWYEAVSPEEFDSLYYGVLKSQHQSC